jgi:WD40 repeat protein
VSVASRSAIGGETGTQHPLRAGVAVPLGTTDSRRLVDFLARSPLSAADAGSELVSLWELETGRPIRTLTAHTQAVRAVAITADVKLIVSASEDQTIKVWDVQTGRVLRTLAGHTSAVTSVAVTANGRRVVSASSDYTIKAWDVERAMALTTFHCDASPQCCVLAEENLVIAGDLSGRLHFLRLEE